jgi:hypothetical protein
MEFSHPILRIAAAVVASLACGMASGQQQQSIEGNSAEKTFTMKIELTPTTQRCNAQVSIKYSQRNTMARVEGEVVNSDCAASSGDYTIAVRHKDEQGELHSIEYVEPWQRDDDQPYIFETDYPIGNNVDLIRVRARKVSCICTDPPAESDEPDTKGENNE